MLTAHNQAHINGTQSGDDAEQPRGHSVGLTQSYEFRSFAFTIAQAVMTETGEALATALARARGLRDAKDVWQSAQDESRVCRGVGKPKGVTARNDPERASKTRKAKPPVPPTVSE